jgi:hypothetical protein
LQSYDRDGRFRDGGAVLVDADVEYHAQATSTGSAGGPSRRWTGSIGPHESGPLDRFRSADSPTPARPVYALDTSRRLINTRAAPNPTTKTITIDIAGVQD